MPGIQATAGQVYILLIDNFTANTTPFNLTWSLSGGVTLSCVPLSVEMLSFTGVNMGSKNMLDWVTVSEKEFNYFEIQRSADAENFVTLGRMKAMNNKNIHFTYVFNDDSPAEGVNYYRLKQVDLEGKFEYSEIISIQMGSNEKLSVKNIYPNPTSGQINIDVFSDAETALEIKLTDLLGKTVYTEMVQTAKGLNVFRISEEKIPDGMFFLSLVSSDEEGFKYTQKIIRK
ncbi:MAG: T9SS type A sorting domain-containing protein [Flavobacteriales bacterium]|nr:T9SS type A sorting domain-containing protein [Flavobacteriales bacterium]